MTARLRFDAVFADEPADLVSIQFGRTSLAFVRSGDLGVVFSSERERERDEFAVEPVLSVELKPGESSKVAIGIDARLGAAGSTVRIEVAGKSVEWRTHASDGAATELALSAGRSAPVQISEFEFVLDRPATTTAGDSVDAGFNSRNAEPVGIGSPASDTEVKIATPQEVTGFPDQGTDSEPASASALPRNVGQSGPVSTLEVFTPSVVPRGRPPGTPADVRPRATKPDAGEQEGSQ